MIPVEKNALKKIHYEKNRFEKMESLGTFFLHPETTSEETNP
jgi:hypothetical protein